MQDDRFGWFGCFGWLVFTTPLKLSVFTISNFFLINRHFDSFPWGSGSNHPNHPNHPNRGSNALFSLVKCVSVRQVRQAGALPAGTTTSAPT